MKNSKIIVIGAGFAGSVIAERLANKYHLNVQIFEQRSVLGGNMFDYYDSNGFLIQKYGPHILFTNKTEVIDYLSSFDKLVPHDCVMMSYLDGKYIQLPFNFKSVCQLIGYQKASAFITHMRELYHGEQRISVYELMNSKDEEISSFARLLYSKAFEPYIAKMWGLLPNQIDKSVINRVKFCPGYSTRYLDRDFQFLPSNGFTVLMSRMTKSPKIKITYSTDGCSKMKFDDNYIVDSETHQRIPVIYSGSIDRLFNYCYGHLPYRSLITKVNYYKTRQKLPCEIISMPQDPFLIRKTEYKFFTPVVPKKDYNKTVVVSEKPVEYDSSNPKLVQCYPIINNENNKLYEKYQQLASKFENLYLCGRLAEYRYYNMDDVILHALEMADQIGNKYSSLKDLLPH